MLNAHNLMNTYIAINSSQIEGNIIANTIKDNLSRIINIGDKKTYSNDLYDYSSCEYSFRSDNLLISDIIESVKFFVEKNMNDFQSLYKMDNNLSVSLRIVVELDGKTTPDTFFDSDFLFLLCKIKADLDIDMYYK